VYLDFADDDARVGGYVRLVGSSFWAAVVGVGDHPLVALRDDDVPRRRGLDVRTDGLWVSITCETPNEHWSVGMEAFATGYDDPAAAAVTDRGDVVALGFDLEWERAGDRWRVTGDLLVGDERISLDLLGTVGDDVPPGPVGTVTELSPAGPLSLTRQDVDGVSVVAWVTSPPKPA
jgi:hypothetical protein